MSSEPAQAVQKVGLWKIFWVFFHLGSVTFGGMWAAAQKLEKELVDRLGWMTREELQAMMVASTLIPSPKFLGFGGLVGFRMGKWLGSILAIIGLVTPGTLLVFLGVFLINPSLLEGPLAPLNKSIGIAVVGLLFGNAFHQIKGSKVSKRNQIVGICLSLALFLSFIAGVPLIIVAIAGFVLGAIFIRERNKNTTVETNKGEKM